MTRRTDDYCVSTFYIFNSFFSLECVGTIGDDVTLWCCERRGGSVRGGNIYDRIDFVSTLPGNHLNVDWLAFEYGTPDGSIDVCTWLDGKENDNRRHRHLAVRKSTKFCQYLHSEKERKCLNWMCWRYLFQLENPVYCCHTHSIMCVSGPWRHNRT